MLHEDYPGQRRRNSVPGTFQTNELYCHPSSFQYHSNASLVHPWRPCLCVGHRDTCAEGAQERHKTCTREAQEVHERFTRGAREVHERCTRGAREVHERGTRGAREGHKRCTRGAREGHERGTRVHS